MKRLFLILFIVSNLSLYAQKLAVGTLSISNAHIIKFIEPDLKELGYDIEIKEFNDYFMPNYALENGDIYLHFGIGLPYMKEFNPKNTTHMFPLDIAVINMNYVLGVNLNPKRDTLALKDSENTHVNYLIVKECSENLQS
ncbi:MetQ/NlpA family ABC transporter substrate-binding protein [Campylobacter sputorum]|uniref:MetQ/NlpA family ABC transporter substrate-binding protein n=1 Tax=Campylobacter sputorum TaxID=206 RepID=UPI00053BF2FB|nr:MetQ/NlpA family ABC transporter substrate-binding protein [Campylobacter sputorum]